MADFFVWDANTLGLNVKEMDDEHKVLIRLMNQLHAGYIAKKPFDELNNLLNELANFTHKHFTDEEQYMEKIKFPGLSSHKLIHQSLLGQLSNHAEQFQKTQMLTDDLFKFLSVWLTSHIKGIDMKYASHASTNTPKKTA